MNDAKPLVELRGQTFLGGVVRYTVHFCRAKSGGATCHTWGRWWGLKEKCVAGRGAGCAG